MHFVKWFLASNNTTTFSVNLSEGQVDKQVNVKPCIFGNLPRKERQVKKVRDRLGDYRGSKLKEERGETILPRCFLGVKFKELLLHFRLSDCLQGETFSRAGEKEGEASGIVTLEGLGDEEMLDVQGGMAESNRNVDLMKW